MKAEGYMDMILPYCTEFGRDYEYHKIRCRYNVFQDFDVDLNGMDRDQVKFKVSRYLTFPWWYKWMEFINWHDKFRYYYEVTFIRYLFPGFELKLKFTPIKANK